MNPFAEQEARFAQALHQVAEAAKAAGKGEDDSIELADLTAERDQLAARVQTMQNRLQKRNSAIADLKSKLDEQSEIIDDVDAVIDGLRNQMEGN